MSDDIRPKAGIYHGCRGILGSEQYAVSNNGTDQIAVDVFVPELERGLTTFLFFSDAAAPFAIERLRALGWQGTDLLNLSGIDQKDVSVQIKYEVFDGKERMKVDIVTGGGRIKLDNPMDERTKRAFGARMKSFLSAPAGVAPRPSPASGNASNQRREGAYDPGPPHDDDVPF